MSNINFGIDLGTTNSAIAKYKDGQLSIYKNPVGFKDTLASVVSYRRGRIQVGDKAREQIVRSPLSVFSSFKRKMGTGETYFVKDIDQDITPIELSSKVLTELKNFVTDEELNSVVITIPASFDTIQSNATKKAGYLAGIDEVVLLQEPIAACLAYSNKNDLEVTEEKKWLVYDFGGGTFDIALVKINHRELKIIDHKGNNFLGGLDIDNLIVEKLVIPNLEKELGEKNLWKKLTSDDIKYKKLYVELLFKSEEIKKELSVKKSAILEIDNDDFDVFTEITITTDDFNKVISNKFDESYKLVTDLLNENSLAFNDIERIIMVGGTTYIPYIREELKQRTNIKIDTSIDPTTAVVAGAAYYAGNKVSNLIKKKDEKAHIEMPKALPTNINIKWIYETSTKDEEELITAVIGDDFKGFYRIIRQDGGFDSAMKSFNNRFSEFVPLLTKTSNKFRINIYDASEKLVLSNNDITISNGFYNISGQPLPNDISIELDDEDGKSYLEQIFKKNQILPLKKTIYKTSSKTIANNSDDKLIINIVEGHGGNLPSSNLSIGYIELFGKDFSMDLLRGMEIELEFEMSESRDLSVGVYISSLDIEINEVFNPSEKSISTQKIIDEIKFAIDELLEEKEDAEFDENFNYLAKLQTILENLTDLYHEGLELIDDNTTGRKYQLDDKKRKAIQQYDNLVKSKQVIVEIDNYNYAKQSFIDNYLELATEAQKREYQKIIKDEKDALEAMNKYVLQRKTKRLNKLSHEVYIKGDELYYDWYYHFSLMEASEFTKPRKYEKLMNLASEALDKQDVKRLKSIVNQLYSLLIVKPKDTDKDNFTDGNLGLK